MFEINKAPKNVHESISRRGHVSVCHLHWVYQVPHALRQCLLKFHRAENLQNYSIPPARGRIQDFSLENLTKFRIGVLEIDKRAKWVRHAKQGYFSSWVFFWGGGGAVGSQWVWGESPRSFWFLRLFTWKMAGSRHFSVCQLQTWYSRGRSLGRFCCSKAFQCWATSLKRRFARHFSLAYAHWTRHGDCDRQVIPSSLPFSWSLSQMNKASEKLRGKC